MVRWARAFYGFDFEGQKMFQFNPNPRVLVIGAHTDDAELGAGGLISRLTRTKTRVSVAHLSDTRNIYGSATGDRLRREATEAFSSLGGDTGEIYFADFPTRHFSEHRQEILDFLINLRDATAPDIVIGPSEADSHQDHRVVAEEIVRAFRGATILAYELFWNLRIQDTTVVAELSSEDVRRKVFALAQYGSQASKTYMEPEVITSQLRVRGSARGFSYGESFSPVQINLRLPNGDPTEI